MESLRLFFHSPFTIESVSQGEGPSLLLQFILQEVVKKRYLGEEAPPLLAPFDWSWRQGGMYKVMEHGMLMQAAFRGMEREIEAFLGGLKRPREELVGLLEPFIWKCQKSDGLLLFLFRNRAWFDDMLGRICPDGEESLVRRFRKRGFILRDIA